MEKKELRLDIYRFCEPAIPENILCMDYGFTKIDNNKFMKKGKKYIVKSWNHYNDYVYNITLEEF